MRRTLLRLLLNVSGESPDFRAKPGIRNLLLDVQQSPYKEQFKDYWSTPVPFADREYGEKPKLGEPIPARRAATTILVGHNKHIDPAKVAAGEDNDYKVLMMYRESKGQYVKDQFVLPSFPVSLEDTSEDWNKVLRRRGVTTQWADLHHRLAAMRALFVLTNLLLIPKEGGVVAEVEGPPGPRRWFLICNQYPKAIRQLMDVLELPMESTLSQLMPFRTIVTPTTETFRFANLSYLVTLDKIPDVQYTLSTVGEKLVWVSPMEALARFNAGIMNMPTPNVIALSELHNEFPIFAALTKKTNRDVPRKVQPVLYHHGQEKVATVLLPGDMFHPETTPEDRASKYVRRFAYEKDFPFGVRAVFDERPATAAEEAQVLEPEKPALLEEANDMDMVYSSIPYPKWQRIPQEGKTAYPVPQYNFQEGRESDDGLIPLRHDHMGRKSIDLYSSLHEK